jgi:hypothetical protein
MSRGGRRLGAGGRPKPTALKVLTGTFREDRHAGEAAVPAEFPEPPSGLSERERATWQELKGLCGAWAASSDRLAFHGVVSLYDRLRRNQEAQTATPEAGAPVVAGEENPLITQETKLWRELRAWIAITGLSPVDRARVPATASGATKESALSTLIRRGRQQ